MRSTLGAAIVLGALLAVACSLVVDTDGLTGGGESDAGPAAHAPDATTVSNDASSSDSADSSTAGDDGATPPSRGCAGSTDFLCADFDDGPVDKGWAEARATSGGTVSLADSFVSAPHSFRATTPASGAVVKQGRLIADVPSLSPKRVTLSMQMMLCDPSGSAFELVKLEEATGGGGIKVFHTGDGSRVEIDLRTRPSTTKAFSAPLPFGRWAHIVIDATYDSSAGSLSIAVDDRVVVDVRNVPTFGDPITGFLLGPWTDGPSNACTAQFDDVRLRFDP